MPDIQFVSMKTYMIKELSSLLSTKVLKLINLFEHICKSGMAQCKISESKICWFVSKFCNAVYKILPFTISRITLNL